MKVAVWPRWLCSGFKDLDCAAFNVFRDLALPFIISWWNLECVDFGWMIMRLHHLQTRGNCIVFISWPFLSTFYYSVTWDQVLLYLKRQLGLSQYYIIQCIQSFLLHWENGIKTVLLFDINYSVSLFFNLNERIRL